MAAGLTFSQLTDEVLFNAFEGSGFTVRAQRFLNEAVDEVGRKVGFPKAYEVAPFDATGTVTSQTTFSRVEEVWLAQGPAALTAAAMNAQATNRLMPIHSDSGAWTTGHSGAPWSYQTEHVPDARPHVAVRILPATGGTGFVAIAGRAAPTLMAADSDTSGLGGEWDDALICFARSRCFRTEDDFQAAQVWMAEFDNHLRVMARIKNPTQDGPIVTPGTWGPDSAPVSGGW